MVNLQTLSHAVKMTVNKFGLGHNSIPWGDAEFLEAQEDITTLTRSHLRRHLRARGEDADGRRTILSNRLRESLDRERAEKRRIAEERERTHRAIATLEEQGAVYVIGTNHKGQLGLGLGTTSSSSDGDGDSLIPRTMFTVIPETRGMHITQVSTRNDLVFAVSEDHVVWCWGSNGVGPMAMALAKDYDNDDDDRRRDSKATDIAGFESPQRVERLDEEDILSIAIGSDTACGLSSSGDIYSWGSGQCGCLGNGNRNIHGVQHCPDLIISLVGNTKIQQISSGAMHYAALSDQGDVYCWGLGASGRLGVEERFLQERIRGEDEGRVLGGPMILPSPHIIRLPSPHESITMISCGAEHTIAASRSKIYTWGNNDGGRLGHGDMVDRHQPCEMESLRGLEIIDISAGTWHSACIAAMPPMKDSGWVYTWGSGYKGQLGQDAKSVSTLPTIMTFFCQNHLTAKKVICGSHHNAVITSDKELYTWGSNQNGCLGHDIDEDLVNFTAKPGYCAGFGAIVNRIGRGFAKSVALGKGYTIVATERYMGPTEEQALDLMEEHRIQVEEESAKNAQEVLKEKQKAEFRRMINEREAEVKFLAAKRGCSMSGCDCKAFQVKSSQPSICRECGHSSVYHTIEEDGN